MLNKKYLIFFSILLTALLFLTACAADENNLPEAKKSAFLMNTLVQVSAYGKNAEPAVAESIKKIEEIENLMSKTKKSSDIYNLNNSPNKKIAVNKETLSVLKKAKDYARMTEGDFDPTIGSLVELWGIGTENPTIPSQAEIETALLDTDYNYLNLFESTAEISKAGVQLDLGAIAKGYAAEEVKKVMQKYDIKHALINLGGNVLVVGNKVDGSSWKIGIQDPRENEANVMAVVDAVDLTIVTSGNYERYFKKNNKLYHHIIDPKTGYPAENNLLSVSIVSQNSFDADALSTAVYVMGLKKGMKFIEKLESVELMFITKELDVYLSPGLEKLIKITDPDFNLIQNVDSRIN